MITIRQATLKDSTDCMNLYAVGSMEAPEAYAGVSEDAMLAAVERGDTTVAEETGRVVGMISAIPAGDLTWLGMLVVDRDHRNHQIAPILIRAAQARWTNLTMSIVAPHALESFRRAGFSEKGYLVAYEI